VTFQHGHPKVKAQVKRRSKQKLIKHHFLGDCSIGGIRKSAVNECVPFSSCKTHQHNAHACHSRTTPVVKVFLALNLLTYDVANTIKGACSYHLRENWLFVCPHVVLRAKLKESSFQKFGSCCRSHCVLSLVNQRKILFTVAERYK